MDVRDTLPRSPISMAAAATFSEALNAAVATQRELAVKLGITTEEAGRAMAELMAVFTRPPVDHMARPAPLPIDGHAYHRRQKNRKGRG